MIIVFIAHLLKVIHAGFVDIVDRFSIFIGVDIVVIVDDNFALVESAISDATEEEVFGETQRSQHGENVDEQTEQSNRRG